MDINRANLDALFTGYNQAFRDAFALAGIDYLQFCMEVTTGTKITEFPFLEQLSGMREWLGPRQVKNISSNKLQVAARHFEDTVGIPVDDIEDDQYGVYTPIVGQMGQNAGNLTGELAFAALVGNGNWLDGAAFFGTTRKFGSNTIANYVASALTPTTYGAARLAMMSYLGHGGKPLGVVPNLLVVGPKNETNAKKILENDKLVTMEATGESSYTAPVAGPNPYFGTAKLQVSTQLVGNYDDYWFLMDTRGVVKPVVITKRKAPQLVRKDQPDAENVFWQGKLIYGSDARVEAALAYPHLAYAGIL
jgi:phage major head subunit gpT-like protein